MTDDDAELVALIDNELDGSEKTALLARLAADERLRQRYEELRQTGPALAASFDALLDEAPVDRLRAALPAHAVSPRPSWRLGGIALRELAAGIVIGLLAAGAAVWGALTFWPSDGNDDWRSAVAEYTQLYTNETFTPLNPDGALEAAELSAVGAKVGATLTPDAVALPGLRFTTAFVLRYDGHPLAVMAYVDPSGAPVLLCILANQAPDAPLSSERRGDLSLASWTRNGRSHLIIGRLSEERAVALARLVEPRV
jgi:anti-sigma factor RsiW